MEEKPLLYKIDNLSPHPLNKTLFRSRTQEEIQSLADDIQKNGLIYPIEITPEGVIIKGESRYHAVKLLGWEDVPVVMRHYESEDRTVLELTKDNTGRRQLSFRDRVRIYKHFFPEAFQNGTIEKSRIEEIAKTFLFKTSLVQKDLYQIRSGKHEISKSIQFADLKMAWTNVFPDASISVTDLKNDRFQIQVVTSKNKKKLMFGPGKYSIVMKEAFRAAKSNYFQTAKKVTGEVGDLIRHYRKEAGLTQKQLANKIHISQSYLSEIEKGIIKGSIVVLDDVIYACTTHQSKD
ncbi:Spo0J and HipB domain-containing protein [Leptospira levettii]|uniref:Spo0J and HipB domain-containing protein n=1 Tax=Leptospira levettii TaxID=2023178 RepID=UPI0013FDEEE9|nr:ParB N-terminal domain-containing protein [Leptospira levettii]